MGSVYLIGALGVTCLAAYLWGTRRVGLSGAGLRDALAATLETIGLAVLFLAANLTPKSSGPFAAPHFGMR